MCDTCGPNTDPRIAAAAHALWAEFDYLLPADPNTVARIAVEAADDAEPTLQAAINAAWKALTTSPSPLNVYREIT